MTQESMPLGSRGGELGGPPDGPPDDDPVVARVRAFGRDVSRDPSFTSRLRVELMVAHKHRARLRVPARLWRASRRMVLAVAVLAFGGGLAAARALPSSPNRAPASRTILVGQGPSLVAVDARTGHIFVVDGGGPAAPAGVEMLARATGAIVHRTVVGQAPSALGVDEGSHHAFVVNSYAHAGGQGTVSVLDTRDGRIVRLIPAGYVPYALVLDAATHRAFVLDTARTSGGHGAIYVLDTVSGRPLGTMQAGVNDTPMVNPGILAVDGCRGRLLAVMGATGGGSVAVLDTSRRTLVASPAVGPYPFSVAVDVRAGHSFVASAAGVTMIDTTSGRVLRRLGRKDGDVLVDQRQGLLFVGLIGGLAMFDTGTGRLLRTIALGRGGGARPLAVDEGRGRVFVVAPGRFDASGLPLGNGVVDIVDARSGQVLRRAPVGREPYAAAVDGRTGQAFVANALGNSVSMLDAPAS